MKTGSINIFILFIALLAPAFSLAGEAVIIANENVTASTLAKDDIKQIFLGKKNHLGQ